MNKLIISLDTVLYYTMKAYKVKNNQYFCYTYFGSTFLSYLNRANI